MIFYACNKVFSYRFDPWWILGYQGLWGHFENAKNKFCVRIYMSTKDMEKYKKFVEENPIDYFHTYRLELKPDIGNAEWRILNIATYKGRFCSSGSS